LYGMRHGLDARRAVDGTLVFGVPLVGFGLPLGSALSALALSGFYLALAAALLRVAARRSGNAAGAVRWLAECFAVLGVGFLTLAIPLALDARWTSAAWAVEGAAVWWMGRRQGRWLARATGLVLQVLAGLAYLDGVQGLHGDSTLPLANPAFLGGTMLALAAGASTRPTRRPCSDRLPRRWTASCRPWRHGSRRSSSGPDSCGSSSGCSTTSPRPPLATPTATARGPCRCT
ncbi:MAG: DUF2339 domain-containing protein, partial [Comamonadaceae bacterium]